MVRLYTINYPFVMITSVYSNNTDVVGDSISFYIASVVQMNILYGRVTASLI